MLRQGRLGTFTRRALIALAACVAAALLMVAAGAATGRFRPLPVDERGADVHIARSSIAVVVPVSLRSLHDGDTVLAQPAKGHKHALYKLRAVDSWTHEPIVEADNGKQVTLSLGDSVWRVSTVVPFGGTLYRLLVGTLQALLLIGACMALIARAAVQRRRREHVNELPASRETLFAMLKAEVACAVAHPKRSTQRPFFSRPWWWTRFAAIIVGTLGVLSLTASATYVGSVAVSQGAITAAHTQLTAPGAGSTNRLALGATTIVPGDRMQRAIDISTDASTTSGAMTGMTLTVSASPSSALNTDSSNGLRIFVQDCRTRGGASGWAESGSTPAFTYACTKGGGGAWNDLLNSSPTNDPTAVPAANTCASSSGGTGSYRALSELSSAYTLQNLPTLSASTTLHLVVTMCFPTAAGDSFQDTTSTLTFTFAGVQRSGTNK